MHKVARAALTALTAGTLGMLAAPAHPAAAASPTRVEAVALDQLPRLHDHTAVQAAVVLDTTAYPLAGEGMIRVTSRICGNATAWQTNAARNNVVPPVYLVLLGQRLTISCSPAGTASTTAQPAAAAGEGNSAGWANPLPGACIVSPFGQWRGTYAHQGVDLSAGSGTPIRAAAAGSVSVGWQAGGAGNYTMINHGGGVWSVYMHQSSFAVRSGWVNAGQTIGYVGSTGDSTGPHLHLETHTGGLWNGRVDPVSFLSARGVRLGC